MTDEQAHDPGTDPDRGHDHSVEEEAYAAEPDETHRDDDDDRPDEIDEAVEPEFGEHDEAEQETEWSEDAREGGV